MRDEELLKKNGMYAKLWNAQQALENYGNFMFDTIIYNLKISYKTK